VPGHVVRHVRQQQFGLRPFVFVVPECNCGATYAFAHWAVRAAKGTVSGQTLMPYLCTMTGVTISRITKQARKPLPNRSSSARAGTSKKARSDDAKSDDAKSADAKSADARSRRMLAAMLAFRDGNFSVRLPSDWDGVEGQIAAAFNQAVSHEDQLKREVARLRRAIGHEGRLKERIPFPGAMGGWAVGVAFNTIEATMRTEGLLEQSQQLTVQLQVRQNELQRTNEELAAQARLLAEQNAEVERKSVEVEHARHALEEKAAELALTAKYKSEFLANMSHELRTPLGHGDGGSRGDPIRAH
jgi:hypothetical protein